MHGSLHAFMTMTGFHLVHCGAFQKQRSVLHLWKITSDLKMHTETTENFKIKDPCFQNAPGVTWRPVKNGRTPGEVHHVVLKLSCLWWAWNKSDFYWKTLLKYWSNFGVKCQIYEYKSSIMASNEQQYLVMRTASNNWLSARITQYITKTWRHE